MLLKQSLNPHHGRHVLAVNLLFYDIVRARAGFPFWIKIMIVATCILVFTQSVLMRISFVRFVSKLSASLSRLLGEMTTIIFQL